MNNENPHDDKQPDVNTQPDRGLTAIEREIYEAAESVIARTQLTADRADGSPVFRYSARAAFQAIAGKVALAIEQQMVPKTDKRIVMLAEDLRDLDHTGYNDPNRLGQVFKTCLFDEKIAPNPLAKMRF